jgi:hypothetical protein
LLNQTNFSSVIHVISDTIAKGKKKYIWKYLLALEIISKNGHNKSKNVDIYMQGNYKQA